VIPAEYSDAQLSLDEDERIAEVLDIPVPGAVRLKRAILEDLDEEDKGIRWWKTPDLRRRILIGDQLVVCCSSVVGNLIEARLHLDGLVSARREFDDVYRDAVSIQPSGLQLRHPRRAPHTDILPRTEEAHIAGFLRAAASALDCLGATIVGVMGLPTDMLKADLRAARRLPKSATTPAEAAQDSFRARFETLVETNNPAGWLEWTRQMRNMLVHRGRRMTVVELAPRPTPVLLPGGAPYLRTRVTMRLPRDPERSEIQAMSAGGLTALVLPGDAVDCATGLLQSCRRLIEGTCDELVTVWRTRRDNPDLIPQPDEQWPSLDLPQSASFGGYGGQPSNARTESTVLGRRFAIPGRVSRARLAPFPAHARHGGPTERLTPRALGGAEAVAWGAPLAVSGSTFRPCRRNHGGQGCV